MTPRRMLAATAISIIAGCFAHSARAEIQIAVAGPMTGVTAAFGDQLRKGAQAAVADINAAGGLLGQKVVLEVADDACEPKQAVAVANKLAANRVSAVVGHYCSGSSIPASDVYEEAGILMITPGSTNPALTEKGKWNVFRVCGRDDQQGTIGAEYFLKNFSNKKIAVLHDKSIGGKGLADEMRKRLNAGGIKEAMYDGLNPGEKDYTAVVSRLKNAGIEAVYYGGYYTELALLQRQSADLAYRPIMMSGDSTMTGEYWQITGPSGEGTLMTFSPDARKNPEAKDVLANLRQQGIEPEGYVLYAYAAAQVWAEAVKQANSLDARKLAEQLKSQTTPTVIGPVQFDAKGDNKAPGFVVYRWHNGSYDYAEN
jgi:branched-chain amino acid transport system substrate-binding protein